jgi:quinol monooxygenase YgiN
MIHVIAVITAKPGQRERILQAFKANVSAVRSEHGCIEYQATVDAQDAGPAQTAFGSDSFVVVEKWQDMAALQAHAGSAHMAAYGASTRELIAKRTIHILSPVAD